MEQKETYHFLQFHAVPEIHVHSVTIQDRYFNWMLHTPFKPSLHQMALLTTYFIKNQLSSCWADDIYVEEVKSFDKYRM